MSPKCINAVLRLHKLLQQVAEELAANRPLLEEEAKRRADVCHALDARLDVDPGCSATYAADLEVARRAGWWAADAQSALKIVERFTGISGMDDIAAQADLAAFMLANRSTVWELSSDDDSRVHALADAARSALPGAPVYALDATARAVLALPVDVAYPVAGGEK